MSYQLILTACAKLRDGPEALRLIKEMRVGAVTIHIIHSFLSKNISHVLIDHGPFSVPSCLCLQQDLRFLPAAPCYTSAISACGACHMKDDALALFHEARRLKVLDKYVSYHISLRSLRMCVSKSRRILGTTATSLWRVRSSRHPPGSWGEQ
jgi:hypothetical protein